ncbi:hypothetical protein F2Q69_00027861 [Brassica cretica]|uniref:Uncharacterized protein n=1 Tax=Brassica cretica TaxID=69181 RepID=A0A8S9S249_BRACR|nr:hypothetical protein F2Q69_00027861 [Brassica cretica]
MCSTSPLALSRRPLEKAQDCHAPPTRTVGIASSTDRLLADDEAPFGLGEALPLPLPFEPYTILPVSRKDSTHITGVDPTNTHPPCKLRCASVDKSSNFTLVGWDTEPPTRRVASCAATHPLWDLSYKSRNTLTSRSTKESDKMQSRASIGR